MLQVLLTWIPEKTSQRMGSDLIRRKRKKDVTGKKLAIIVTDDNQQDATVTIYLLLISSICFGRCFRPSSSANYSCPPMLLLAAGAAYTQPQPAATSVDSCSYSDVLLMMGENIARNM